MSSILSQIIVFFALIAFGILLRSLIKSDYYKKPLKLYILNIALPITIFVSIISIEIDLKYLLYPILALLFNLLLYFISPIIIRLSHITDLKKQRTLLMLLPSFAPGLSCFPIINEFLGYSALAQASIVDVGNKIFVLIVLFFISIRLYNKTQNIANSQKKESYGFVFKSLFYEPINIIMIVALIFLATSNTIEDIPTLILSFFLKIKDSLAPAVFIFIGVSILFTKNEFIKILPLLLIRAGFCLIVVTSIIYLFGIGFTDSSILFLILSLSSVSFWPYAHMTFIDNLEKNMQSKRKTFDLSFGLNLLAYSLPFSTIMILLLFISEKVLYNPLALYTISIVLLTLGFLLLYLNQKKLVKA